MNFLIRPMRADDVNALSRAFASWNKTREQYERYWRQNQEGTRWTFIALVGDELVGYGNLISPSHYTPFIEANIPEINDLNVLEPFRGHGIASAIIHACEEAARARGFAHIGIGFGLTPPYGAAQRLYVRLGYVPDGRGVPFHKLGFVGQGVAVPPSEWDNAALYLTKAL